MILQTYIITFEEYQDGMNYPRSTLQRWQHLKKLDVTIAVLVAVAKSLKSVAVDNRFVDLSKGGILPAGLVLQSKTQY